MEQPLNPLLEYIVHKDYQKDLQAHVSQEPWIGTRTGRCPEEVSNGGEGEKTIRGEDAEVGHEGDEGPKSISQSHGRRFIVGFVGDQQEGEQFG